MGRDPRPRRRLLRSFVVPILLVAMLRCGPPPVLEPGAEAGGEIAAGETRLYRLEAPARHYLEVAVDSRNVDLELVLDGPSPERLWVAAERWRPDVLAVVTESAGPRTLEVRGRGPQAGSFLLRLAAPRPAAGGDQARAAAWRAQARGLELAESSAREDDEEALRELAKAASLWRQAGDAGAEAVVRQWTGAIRGDLSRFAEAADDLGAALDFERRAGDRAAEADVLYRLGNLEYLRGRYGEALDRLRPALAIYEERGEREPAAFTLMHLGYVFNRRTEPQAALDCYRRALELLRALGLRKWQANALNNVGSTLQGMGELDEARERFEQALPISRALGDRPRVLALNNNIGWGLKAQGEAGEALPYLREALRLAEELGDGRYRAVCLDNLGRAYLDLGEPRRTLRHSGQALELSRALGDPLGEAVRLISLGLAHQALGEAGEAADRFSQALAISREIGNRKNEVAALHGLADLRRSAGDLAAALDLAETALGVVEDVRAGVGSPIHKASYLGSQRALYELLVDLHVERARRQPEREQEHLGAALEAHERARARSLLESFSEALADAHDAAGPDLLDAERVLDLDAVRRQVVDDGSLLLEYALGDDRSHLFAVTGERVAAFELPGRREIEGRARRLYELVTQSPDWPETDRARYREAARDLAAVLLGPVAGQLAGQRLLLVAEGALQYVPFAALPRPGGGDRPLVLEHEIVNLPSASVLAALRRRVAGRTPAPLTLAVLADPVFEPADERLARRAATAGEAPPPRQALVRSARDAGIAELQRLWSSRREAEAIGGLVAPGERLLMLGFAASVEAAKSPALGRYRIVHFATHGFLNDRDPELSGLVLSLYDEEGAPRDGFLRLRDVSGLELHADLVVLSACQTALGREIRGEALIGLASGFMQAGARSVVASLWRLDDRATAELMRRFYLGLLRRGLAPAAALARAQSEMAAGPVGGRDWSDPYYWAAFVLQGEWRPP